MKCNFCGKQAVCKSDAFDLCIKCDEERKQAEANKDLPVTNTPRKDPSKLCLQCGLCCFMLSARTTQEEAEKVEAEHGIKSSLFTCVEEFGPNKGELVIRMPCKFLQGRILDHVFCKAHEKYRPEVCGAYLCKMAQKYVMGMISLGEAKFWLKFAYLRADVNIFNWSGDQESDRLLAVSMISNYADQLRGEGADQTSINISVAERITPVYKIKSDTDHLVLNMHFDAFDRGDVDYKLFMDQEEIDGLDKWDAELAKDVIKFVVAEFRERFTRSESPISRILGDRSKVVANEDQMKEAARGVEADQTLIDDGEDIEVITIVDDKPLEKINVTINVMDKTEDDLGPSCKAHNHHLCSICDTPWHDSDEIMPDDKDQYDPKKFENTELGKACNTVIKGLKEMGIGYDHTKEQILAVPYIRSTFQISDEPTGSNEVVVPKEKAGSVAFAMNYMKPSPIDLTQRNQVLKLELDQCRAAINKCLKIAEGCDWNVHGAFDQIVTILKEEKE